MRGYSPYQSNFFLECVRGIEHNWSKVGMVGKQRKKCSTAQHSIVVQNTTILVKATTGGPQSSFPPSLQTLSLEQSQLNGLSLNLGLLQWHKVCKLGGDELHRAPVVALKLHHHSHPVLSKHFVHVVWGHATSMGLKRTWWQYLSASVLEGYWRVVGIATFAERLQWK